MPRTTYQLHKASATFMVRGALVAACNTTRHIKIATQSSKVARYQDVDRVPMVENSMPNWPIPQSYIHDCDVVYKGTRFRLFFQRHVRLPVNTSLAIHGAIIVMRLGKRNARNVVNMHKGDTKQARTIAKKFTTHLALFQSKMRRAPERLIYL
ncbi:hypothetical protein L218DRAFT_476605 [Marasmius fiardii PR-910]|nr:hypothetical protein L218DRAFT_476605 [Marasmius fiardii PR-910]